MELSERKIVGLDLIRETKEKVVIIRNRFKDKTYANLKRKEISFEVGDKIIRFDEKGKLSPRFVRPYEVLEKVGPVAYKLALSSKLPNIHNVFHIEELEVEPNMFNEEELVYILAREVKELRNKISPLVKVLWRNHSTKEATRERESLMRD
ncbi:pol protein [Gossypium australe]|uniref:Pol protein n=1 Tax=Gossypium australe TaxID=47621 RepID=A0A5B6VVK5_9ROSI|nr:pol protein [Gossypium australe]